MVQRFHARTQNPRSVMLDWSPPRKSGVQRYRVSPNVVVFLSLVLLLSTVLKSNILLQFSTLQIVFEGEKWYHDELGRRKKHIAKPVAVTVNKEDHTYYANGLIPKMMYTFNISSKFLDGTWGDDYQLIIETSIDGE